MKYIERVQDALSYEIVSRIHQISRTSVCPIIDKYSLFNGSELSQLLKFISIVYVLISMRTWHQLDTQYVIVDVY